MGGGGPHPPFRSADTESGQAPARAAGGRGEIAGGRRGCSPTGGLEASGWWGSRNLVLRTRLGKCCSQPLRRREAHVPGGWGPASRHPAGLRSWGSTSASRTRNWKSENRADSPQGSRQLHGGRRPPALASRREPSPREAVFARGRRGEGSRPGQDVDSSHTSSVHRQEHDDPEAPASPHAGNRTGPRRGAGTGRLRLAPRAQLWGMAGARSKSRGSSPPPALSRVRGLF